MTQRRALLVSPRPPRPDGRGDQRRAAEILAALEADHEVEVVSWLPDVGGDAVARWGGASARDWTRALRLARRLPLTVAYVQALAPADLARRLADDAYDVAVLVTDRAVPPAFARVLDGRTVLDFVDDLGGTALRRARQSRGPARPLWHWEGRRLRRFDAAVAAAAGAAVAHSPADAARIAPGVRVVPLSVGPRVPGPSGAVGRVVFVGNLAYLPNHEAATWICTDLAPALERAGVAPGRLLLAGRRPRPALVAAARAAGVELRADVESLSDVLGQATVVLSPTVLGAGCQYKVLDACAAGRPCVLSAGANAGLGLADGRSALVRAREAGPFAEAVATLLADPGLRDRIGTAAREQMGPYQPEAVAAAWRRVVAGDRRATVEAQPADRDDVGTVPELTAT